MRVTVCLPGVSVSGAWCLVPGGRGCGQRGAPPLCRGGVGEAPGGSAPRAVLASAAVVLVFSKNEQRENNTEYSENSFS